METSLFNSVGGGVDRMQIIDIGIVGTELFFLSFNETWSADVADGWMQSILKRNRYLKGKI